MPVENGLCHNRIATSSQNSQFSFGCYANITHFIPEKLHNALRCQTVSIQTETHSRMGMGDIYQLLVTVRQGILSSGRCRELMED